MKQSRLSPASFLLLLILMVLATAEARAASITVTASPSAVSVLEGSPGVFNFAVTNVSDIRLEVIPILRRSAAESIFFVSGDRNDEVSDTSVVRGACQVILPGGGVGPRVLDPLESCTFQQIFQTRDLRVDLSGTNVGIWHIGNLVTFAPASGHGPDLDFVPGVGLGRST